MNRISDGAFIRISEFLYALKMFKEASNRLTMADVKELEKVMACIEEKGGHDE